MPSRRAIRGGGLGLQCVGYREGNASGEEEKGRRKNSSRTEDEGKERDPEVRAVASGGNNYKRLLVRRKRSTSRKVPNTYEPGERVTVFS